MEITIDEHGRQVYKITGMQKVIADVFADNWVQAPLVHVGAQINVAPAEKFRKEYGVEHGVTISLMNVIQKAAANACKTYPVIAGLLEGDDKVIVPQKDEIGVAGPIMVGDSAISHFIKRASSKSLIEIARELSEVVKELRSRKLTEEDAKNAFDQRLGYPCLEISNIGMMGPVNFLIGNVVLPSFATLCIPAKIDTPIAGPDGKVIIAPVINAQLTFDHRVLNAGPVAKFLGVFKELIEAPEKLV